MTWSFRHMLAHWTGLNLGSVVSALDGEGNVWIGFECATCGKISGRHLASTFESKVIRASLREKNIEANQ